MKHKVIISDSLIEFIAERTDPTLLEGWCGLFCRGKRWVKKRIDKKAAKAYSG
jgi:hypothetical protein